MGGDRAAWHPLPHWQQPGATFFVTFRLADSIPKSLEDQWREERDIWVRVHPRPWSPEVEREFHRRFPSQIERWLDESHGSCLLRDPRAAAGLAEVLGNFDGTRSAGTMQMR